MNVPVFHIHSLVCIMQVVSFRCCDLQWNIEQILSQRHKTTGITNNVLGPVKYKGIAFSFQKISLTHTRYVFLYFETPPYRKQQRNILYYEKKPFLWAPPYCFSQSSELPTKIDIQTANNTDVFCVLCTLKDS